MSNLSLSSRAITQAKNKLFRSKLNAQKLEKKQRINSPLLRYTEDGQLVCKVCEMVIKSESLWPAHQVSRKHHEAIDKLKAKAAELNQSTNSKNTLTKQVSRPESPAELHEKTEPSTEMPKHQPSKLPANFFDNQETKRQKKDSGKLKDSDLHSGGSVLGTVHVLEPIVSESGTKTTVDLEAKQVKGSLPKGFFDDKDADLRARGIKPVKPDVKDEYKEFEKLIQEDLQEVDDILEEEEIDTAEMIQEEESVEQMTYRERVELLRRKKLELKASKSAVSGKNVEVKHKDSSPDDSSSDDENFVVDWRAKHL